MGTGTDVAMQSAGVTLVKGDLAARPCVEPSDHENIRQSLVLAFVYNVLGIPLAAGVLYPAVAVKFWLRTHFVMRLDVAHARGSWTIVA
jgi:Cu+-exporting ATPase